MDADPAPPRSIGVPSRGPDTVDPSAAVELAGEGHSGRGRGRAGYGSTLVLTVTLATATFLALMAALISATHPGTSAGAPSLAARLIDQQNQTAKTTLYVTAFVVILPAALILVPRLADAIARGPNGAALPTLSLLLASGLAVALIAARVSHRLPWGYGLRVVLAAVLVWALIAGAGLWRAARGGPWPAVLKLPVASTGLRLATGALVFAAVLSVTSRGSLHALPLVLAALAGAALLALGPGLRSWAARVPSGAVDVVAIVVLALAIPNVVIYVATGALPNVYFPPGVIQNQQDYLLGSANQLLGGGALLVNVPISQYGVGLIYFLDGWFHVVPIGYATLGLLDSILWALFYMLGYAILRVAGTRPLQAAAALAVAVVGLVYALVYNVGALPETGPLRFGLPMALVLAKVCEARWPRRRAFQAAGFVVVGVSAVWAFEAFSYTLVTFASALAIQTWLRADAGRWRWLARQVALALAACVAAHLVLAVITLAITGRLPDWGQYLTYIHSFLLGGTAGTITFGFANWSPVLAVGAAALTSAAALVLLAGRLPGVARREPVMVLALAATTGYAIALLSYADNRSLTYLLPYLTLPLLIAATLWLALVLRAPECSAFARRGAAAFAIAVTALMISAAWPSIGRNFSQSALARAYPGGGLPAAIHRILHPPPIDPRAPVGVRLLNRYVPGHRALIVLPVDPDLGIEILMRGGRTNSMFIGDPVDDSLVPSLWMRKLSAEVAGLRAGQRLLINDGTLFVLAALRAHPNVDPSRQPIAGGNLQLEWLLKQIDRRFAIKPLARARDGLIVAELVSRGPA